MLDDERGPTRKVGLQALRDPGSSASSSTDVNHIAGWIEDYIDALTRGAIQALASGRKLCPGRVHEETAVVPHKP